MVKASERKVLAHKVVSTNKMSIALACRTFMISETCYRYTPILRNENLKIAKLLLDLTELKRSWGFGLCFLYLRNEKSTSGITSEFTAFTVILS
ncbi:putative transposase [Pseudoalteromonas translucida]|uniref:Transposase n=1 Tax=Pseudoalteromonas translucida (strain TAC 125) TaxID=326442 RepID=Q3IIF4_PSET1|nr:putative transposase [Pseudoalteromonas translucida]